MRPWPLFLLLPACATIVDGRTQPLHVATDPPGAACTFTRHGTPVATIPATPATIRVERSRDELSLLCQLPGHEPARAFLRSEARLGPAANAGDDALLAGPAYAIDSLTFADRRYRDDIHLVLPPSR